MIQTTFWVLISIFCFVSPYENVSEISTNIIKERGSKWLPWVGVVRFENGACQSAIGLTGTCYTRKQCRRLPGVASGFCARKIGVCCVAQRSCGATSSANNTYFINPGFLNGYSGGASCTMTVQRCNPDICQLRLDFLSLTLTQPDQNGVCSRDKMTITGAGSTVPSICGENTGQHMYMDFGGEYINIVIDTTSGAPLSRYWNIKVTQISCEGPTRAPAGCLQHFTSLSGTAKSFNYGTSKNPVNDNMGTRQLASLNYGVCVGAVPGYCSIRWSQSGDLTSFTVSGDTDGIAVDILGTAMAAQSGSVCTSDFVIIPSPRENGMMLTTDRFCGNGFVSKTTFSKPFVLTVVNDQDEITNTVDIGNRGFSLDYQQLRCGLRN